MSKNKTKEVAKMASLNVTVSSVNSARQAALSKAITEINYNRELAAAEMADARDSIHAVIDANRGSYKGVHGFIGERAQCAKCNADALVRGKTPIYKLLDDNGPVDYMKGPVPVQQKACRTKGAFGIGAVQEHAEKYPWFEYEGLYQIPKDFYKAYQKFANMPADIAGKLRNEEYRQYLEVKAFLDSHPMAKIEPMEFTYAEIQKGTIDSTLDRVEREHDAVASARVQQAKARYSANIAEGLKVSAYSAAAEGLIDGAVSFYGSLKAHDSITELNLSDYKKAGIDAAKGAVKGTVRGGAVYALTNAVHVSAPVASAVVNGGMALCEDAGKYIKGEMKDAEFKSAVIEDAVDIGANVGISLIAVKLATDLLPSRYKPLGVIAGTILGGKAYGLAKIKVKELINSSVKEPVEESESLASAC